MARIAYSLGVALDRGDRLEINTYFSFVYASLSALCKIELPPDSRMDYLAELEAYVPDVLEAWRVDLPEKAGSVDQRI